MSAPFLVSSWDRTIWRRVEALRDKMMDRIGTKEALIAEHTPKIATWRKPLSLEEVNRMAPTPDVRRREGRP